MKSARKKGLSAAGCDDEVALPESVVRSKWFGRSYKLCLNQTLNRPLLFVNLHHYFPARIDVAAIHACRVEWHGYVAIFIYRDDAALSA